MKRTPIRRRVPLRRGPPPRRTTPLTRNVILARRTPLVVRGTSPASAAQRAKVAGARCLACGRGTRVDPAHLVARSLGGCDDPDCVCPLCRGCHRAFDTGRLDLVPLLEPDYRTEVAHAVGHLGLVGALRRLSGRRDADDMEEGRR